ncbi:MAG TPA: response regulator, partial [Candidatus Polarisedimenticolia bacterium]|nr:response regulator [Candidatus Polarisedimenticolia bacterium]
MKSPGQFAPDKPPPPILIVDDEDIVLAALKETLKRANYDVVPISDPVAALEEIKKREFSAIITDQSMPNLTGLELLGQAREIQPYATRILVTAVLDLDTVIDAINKGEIYRFVVKPWLREELLATVKNAVQRHELIVSNHRLQAETQAINQKLSALN